MGLSERVKGMMKCLRALILLKDKLTNLQNHDQSISKNIKYFNYNYDVFSSSYYYTIVIMPITKEDAKSMF